MSHRIDPTILREYDVRGVVGGNFHIEDAYHLGRAVAARMAKNGTGKRVCTGYDGRLSSPDIEESLTRGLIDSGMEVLRVGLGPSPMLYYAIHHHQADGGVMVTASHNPPEYNGMKFTLNGRSLSGKDISDLGACTLAGDYVTGKGSQRSAPVAKEYVDRLRRDYPPLSWKIAWDPGNGASCDILHDLTDQVSGQHIHICDKIDGRFPHHHPDPSIAANLRHLQRAVLQHQCDIGIAFDGDADRVGFVDRNGAIIPTEHIILLLAQDVLKRQPGATIVLDVKAGPTLRRALQACGADLRIVKTGHSHIKNALIDYQAAFGGEISSHLFFNAPYYGYDDGLYAAVRLLALLHERGVALDEICRTLPRSCSIDEIRLDYPEEEKFSIVRRLSDDLRSADVRIDETDGLAVHGKDYWFLLRPSNTQPIICLLCEAETPARLKQTYQHLTERFAVHGLKLPPFAAS